MGESGQSQAAAASFGPREVRASDAARTLGFEKRALNDWCLRGIAGEVCPSEMRQQGKQRVRFVNLDEVRAWRTRVGLEADRNPLFNAPADPPASEPVEPAAATPINNVDQAATVMTNLLSQLRAQVQRLAEQSVEKVSAQAIASAAQAAKNCGQELRLLMDAVTKREAAVGGVVTRARAEELLSQVAEAVSSGLRRVAADAPMKVRDRLQGEAGASIAVVHAADTFDRIVAQAVDEAAESSRKLIADTLASIAGELGTDVSREAA